MQYRKIKYGPVSDSYFRIIDEMFDSGEIDINQTKDGAMLISQTRSGAKIDLSKINKKEEELIENIEKKWKGKKTTEIVDFTHKQFPYLYAQDNEVVSYGLLLKKIRMKSTKYEVIFEPFTDRHFIKSFLKNIRELGILLLNFYTKNLSR